MAQNLSSPTDLCDLTVAQSAALIASKALSPVELTQAILNRIDQVGEPLAAFVSVHHEEAMAVAKAAEAMMQVGYNVGPLHGVPLAIKDNISLAGRATSAASKILKGKEATEDAEVVRRLKGAGANLLANTNMHEFAWGATSENPHYGVVRNPWNTACIASGSSGGSGAAVAARAVPAALGTDTGGSIRLPAGANGIVGIRPTVGRVSGRGIIPLAWSMDTCGPMTRTVEDCALLLQVIAGHDPSDLSTSRAPVADYLATLEHGVKGLRIGVIPEYFFTQLQPSVLKATQDALDVLRSLGAIVVETSIADLELNLSALMTVESAEPSAFHQRWMRERPEDYGENVRFMFEQGELYLASHYIQAQRFRSVLRQRFMDRFSEGIDAFVLPSLPFTAPEIGTANIELEPGVVRPTLEAIMRFTGIASVTGLPALSVPSGFDQQGLPIGLQLLGRPFDEGMLFRIGHGFQGATDYHLRKPALLN
ncbi:MAG: amidase [Paenalcaligenes sp.]|uniref:amidase n=1 Tax=Paenalcaligenes suwonensis TaxID=1202713 RepID=UPI00140D3CD3|nr:amidase [Paenalcaligenes suwonensis]NHC63216.1 amidase [Paenalcaligenes suwonensis]